MKCLEFRHILSEYLDDMLEPSEKVLAEKHLSTCKECLSEFETLKASVNEIQSLARIKAPNDFLTKIHQRLGQKTAYESFWHKLFFPLQVRIPLAAMAILLIVIGGIYVFKSPKSLVQVVTKDLGQRPDTVANQFLDKNKNLEGEKDFVEKTVELEKVKTATKKIKEKPIEEDVKPKPVMVAEVPVVFKAAPETAIENIIQDTTKFVVPPVGVALEKPVEKLVTTDVTKKQEPIKLALLIEPKKDVVSDAEGIINLKGRKLTATTPEYFTNSKIAEKVAPALLSEKNLRKENAPEITTAPVKNEQIQLPDINQTLSEIKNMAETLEGKVLSINYDEKTGKPQYINVEIAATNYNSFLQKLGQVGKLYKSLLGEPPKDKLSVQLQIELILPK